MKFYCKCGKGFNKEKYYLIHIDKCLEYDKMNSIKKIIPTVPISYDFMDNDNRANVIHVGANYMWEINK